MGDSPNGLRYGQKLRLATRSVYVDDSIAAATSELGIGYYEKNGRHGILSCVPPLGPNFQHLFAEDEFVVVHPNGQQHSSEDQVYYGDPLVLVNQHGMVWNNKTGGITGYVGPRPRGISGEMFVCFAQGSADEEMEKSSRKDKGNKLDKLKASVTTSALSMSGSLSVVKSYKTEAGPVCFGDSDVAITVVESNRRSQVFNRRLSNYKKATSRIAGGYICCDGSGTELRFSILPAYPKIKQVSMMDRIITPYNYGQKIALPLGLLGSTVKEASGRKTSAKRAVQSSGMQQGEILFQCSNGAQAVLSGTLLQQKMLTHTKHLSTNRDEIELVFELPLQNAPGVLVVRLTGVAPRTFAGKPCARNGRQLSALRTKRGVAILYYVSDLLRLVPVPIFALIYAAITRFLWGTLTMTEGGLRHELAVLVLVMLPVMYAAVKVDHPFSALFLPPVFEPEVHDATGNEITQASGSLKIIVKEYRFRSASGLSANGSASKVESVRAPNLLSRTPLGHSTATALEATGSIPMRFILAEKGDRVKALERYNETTEWRREEGVDFILEEPCPYFRIIKDNYPHFYHKRGKNGEPVYYEKPGKINMKALKNAGLTLDDLMHNLLMITEFLWQVIEQDDNCKGISVLDVDGIGISDFAGEAVEYVRNAASLSGRHYPERCAYIFVINVPSWFSVIWNSVKGMVDDVTREKVIIVRGKKNIFEALSERIPVDNIPVEYGGTSDGKSSEEDLLYSLMDYVNNNEGAPATNPIAEILKRKPIKH
uniref:CRAL-TRIO domain-containing protein n=1 Tax=Hyaloperonospora arabidopsidis (strain Emoy2) TaxID=559515 RepID=M4B677_HYAAE